MTSRNVVNHAEFTSRLGLLSHGMDTHISKYVNTVVRKHFLKNWSRVSAVVRPAAKGVPKFDGFRDADTHKLLNKVPLTLQTPNGPQLQYVDCEDPMYIMSKQGETVFLDINYLGEIQDEIQDVVHWLRIKYPQPRDLSMIAYVEAKKKATEWRIQLELDAEKTRKAQVLELQTKALAGLEHLAVGTYTVNGEQRTCFLLRLTTGAAFTYEGLRLHHCVGDHYYWNRYEEGLSEIWSFRYSLMEPAFTIEVDKTSTIVPGMLVQCRGLQNRSPDWEEALMITEGLQLFNIDLSLFPQWTNVSQYSVVNWSKFNKET